MITMWSIGVFALFDVTKVEEEDRANDDEEDDITEDELVI